MTADHPMASEQLRGGLEEALVIFGHGFLSHPENGALRAKLRSGALSTTEYFNQLLRLVWRIIFLIAMEERGLLHPDGTSNTAKARYAQEYSLRNVCERAEAPGPAEPVSDLWEATKVVFRGLERGEPNLGLPALGGIFSANGCPALDAAHLESRAFLLAGLKLTRLNGRSNSAPASWGHMSPDEIGNLLESLLELVPQIAEDGSRFALVSGGAAGRLVRRTSGGYATPDELVQVLLDGALDPIVADTIAGNPADPVQALLELTIVDPACGSGQFLLAAARRLASHVARLRAGGETSNAEHRRALRLVVAHCIFGVDLNPMAVELCKVSLWLDTVDPDQPLAFLDSHIQHGDALLGATPELMAGGIPDGAWGPIEGDDPGTASKLQERNRQAAARQRSLEAPWPGPRDADAQAIARAVAELEAASDVPLEALVQKEARWSRILGSAEYRRQKQIADAWCAAFVWPKAPGALEDAAPTHELWRQLRDGDGQPSQLMAQTVDALAGRYRFFHWHLQFPQVFAKGGFDVVLGNPPWQRLALTEREFFAPRSREIAHAPGAAARKTLISQLPIVDPPLWEEWCAARRDAAGQDHLIRRSGRYPLCGKGSIATYAIFAEHARHVLNTHGRAGIIVPSAIATDATNRDLFEFLVGSAELAAFFSFENAPSLFPTIHPAFQFALMLLDVSGRSERADLVFAARRVEELSDPQRHFSLSPSEFALLSPNTRTCPTFRSRRDAEINLDLYRRAGVLWRDGDPDGNPWGLRFMTMLHTSSEATLLRPRASLVAAGWKLEGNAFVRNKARMLPVIESKMVRHFDHRFGTYDDDDDASAHDQQRFLALDDTAHADPHRVSFPRYWLPEPEVESRLSGRWHRDWLFGWRDICRSIDRRTLIATLFPRGGSLNISLLLVERDARMVACLYANLCAFCCDYAARQKVGGAHLSALQIKQLPVLAPSTYSESAVWDSSASLRDWICRRVLELTYTAWDLEPFARDCSFEGPPFHWDDERRFALRAELDAAFFHVYRVSRDDVGYILDTFPIVRQRDEKAYGEYRTKHTILEIYDDLDAAMRSREPYRSPLY